MALLRRKKKTAEQPVEPEPAPTLPTPPQVGGNGMRSVADQRDYILSNVEPLTPFGMGLLDAWDLALCEDIRSETDLPAFDNSQMDGYAVRAADVASATQGEPVTLAVAATVMAGDDGDQPLPAGQAIKVMTGAPIPAGADAVVPFEFTDHAQRPLDDPSVKVMEKVVEGEYVRRKGSDVVDGAQLMVRGQRVDSRAIGLLAGAGIDKVLARPRPRVVVVSTGAELVEPGRRLKRPGQIHDANSYMVAAAAKAEGCQVWRVQVASDEPDAVREAIADQLIRADLVITTGGVSKGEKDVVKQVMPELGLCDFAEVAMQPGKPQGFGLVGEDKVPMLMLPGNPVSSYVSFQVFVRPVIRKLMGIEPYDREPVRCIAGSAMRSAKGKLQFGRGLVTEEGGRRTVRLVGGHSSHLLGDLAAANALVLLPEEVSQVEAGDEVMCWLLDRD